MRRQIAGIDSAESLESGLFFAVGQVVGDGAFFPAPFGGLLGGGGGGGTLADCPQAKSRFEGAGRS